MATLTSTVTFGWYFSESFIPANAARIVVRVLGILQALLGTAIVLLYVIQYSSVAIRLG